MADSNKIKIKTPASIEKNNKIKWMAIGVICLAVVILVSTSASTSNPVMVVSGSNDKKLIDTAPGDVDGRLTDRLQANLKSTNKQVKELVTAQKNMLELMELQKQQIFDIQDQKIKLERKLERVTLDAKNRENEFKMPPMANITNADSNTGLKKVNTRSGVSSVPPPPKPGVPYNKINKFSSAVRAKNSNKSNFSTSISGKPMIFHASVAEKEDWDETVKYTKNKYAGAIPPGSFAEVALLSGLDAGASDQARANPQPIFMRIQNNATLPGEASYRLESCFVLGVGYGDISSERAYIQLSKISCVDKNNKAMLVGSIAGYVADSDGTLGLRGKVTRRAGAILAKAMIAGFADGATQILSAAQTSVITGATGGTTTFVDPSDLGTAGLYGGASGAAKILAEQYIKEAKAMFPIIEVPAGRKATVMITEMAQLEWSPYDKLFIAESTGEKGNK